MATPALLARYCSRGRWKLAKHLQLIDRELMDLASGINKRLILTLPPRHGKSMLVSQYFPAWYLGMNPDKQVILSSYQADFASQFGRKARDVLDEYGETLFGLSVRSDSSAADRWGIEDHIGGMQTAGAGGPITGKGADCVSFGTLIQTDRGIVPVEELGRTACRILSYGDGKLEYKAMQAFRKIEGRWMHRITTAAGRVIEATPEHRFFANGRYIEANRLSPGDSLMLAVSEGIPETGLPGIQGDASQLRGYLLLGGVQSKRPLHEESAEVQDLQLAGHQEDAGILRAMPPATAGAASDSRGPRNPVRDLQCAVPVDLERRRTVRKVLLPILREHGPLQEDVGSRQPEVEKWRDAGTGAAAFSEIVQADEDSRPQERHLGVCGMQVGEVSARPPHRRESNEQHGVESRRSVQQLPSQLAQGEGFIAVEDSVALVERLCKQAAVYDIQVEGNRNFFANGILVHNCLIVDDPYKNWQEANSSLIRERMWDWWGSTARTRLEPGGIALVVHTRWHQDDLIGRLLQAQEEGGEKWRVVNFPAISDDGEALWPERYDVPALEEIRRSIRSQYIWEALYQQRPTPREGGLFRAAWLRYYSIQGEYLRLTRFDEHNRPLPDVIVSRREAMVFVTADTATKAKTSADYSVIATWLFHRATGSLALLDVIRKKVDTPDLLPLLSGACLQAKAKFVLIEEASSGTELIQLLRKNNACIGGIPVKSYLTGSLDKVARSAPAQLRMESGMIYFPAFETAWKAECVAELLSFPKSINDDFVDNVSMAAWYAENHNSIHIGGSNASNLPSEIGSGPLLSFPRSSLDQY